MVVETLVVSGLAARTFVALYVAGGTVTTFGWFGRVPNATTSPRIAVIGSTHHRCRTSRRYSTGLMAPGGSRQSSPCSRFRGAATQHGRCSNDEMYSSLNPPVQGDPPETGPHLARPVAAGRVPTAVRGCSAGEYLPTPAAAVEPPAGGTRRGWSESTGARRRPWLGPRSAWPRSRSWRRC